MVTGVFCVVCAAKPPRPVLLCEAWQQGEAREAGRTAVHLGQGLLLTLPHEGVGQAYRGQCSRLHLVVPVYLSSSHL